jgi:hypothetical protein
MASWFKSNDPTGILKGPASRNVAQVQPDTDDQETVAAFMQKRALCKEARSAREKSWEYNRLYIKGEQLIVRGSGTGNVLRVVVEDDSRQKYSVDNLLRPTVRASVGKHVRVVPGVAIVPGGTDREDFLAAEMLEAYKDYVWRTEKLRLKYKRAHEYIPGFGTAIFQLAWDHTKGRRLAWCEQCSFISEFYERGAECPYCKEQAETEHILAQAEAIGLGLDPGLAQAPNIPTMTLIQEGAISIPLHDVRDFHMDPGAIEIDSAQWAFVERSLPVSVIRSRFPEAAEKIVVEDGLYFDKYVSYMGSFATSRVETQYLKDYARLYEYHEMPSAEFPEGQLIYMANGHVLSQGPNPYVQILKRLPFFALRGDRNPGEFYGEAWVDHATGVQKERNKLLTQMRTSRELNLVPQMLNFANNGLAMDAMDTVPGKVYRLSTNGRPPQPIERGQLPAYVETEAMRMAESIKNKAGVTDQELGLSNGAPSGRYAAILDAQSSETIAPIVIENSEEWLEMNRGILRLAQRYESALKKWQVPGHSRVRSYIWSNVNLDWDIELADEDVLSKNPALRLQQALELLQAGVFMNPDTGMPDMKAFQRYAKLKMPMAGADLENVEHSYAAQIPDMIARGANVMPAPWDDANIIAEELLGWLRGPGRNADRNLVQTVAKLWVMYAQAMRPTMSAQNMLPMKPPAMGTPPGEGSPYEGQGAGRQPEGGDEAQSMVQQADQQGEQLAQQQMKHE